MAGAAGGGCDGGALCVQGCAIEQKYETITGRHAIHHEARYAMIYSGRRDSPLAVPCRAVPGRVQRAAAACFVFPHFMVIRSAGSVDCFRCFLPEKDGPARPGAARHGPVDMATPRSAAQRGGGEVGGCAAAGRVAWKGDTVAALGSSASLYYLGMRFLPPMSRFVPRYGIYAGARGSSHSASDGGHFVLSDGASTDRLTEGWQAGQAGQRAAQGWTAGPGRGGAIDMSV